MATDAYTKRAVKLSMVAEKYGSDDPMVTISYLDPESSTTVTLGTDLVVTSADSANPTVITVYPTVKGGETVKLNVRFTNDLYDENGDRNIKITDMDIIHDYDTESSDTQPYIWSTIEHDGVTMTPDPSAGNGFQTIRLTHTADCLIHVDFVECGRPTLFGDQLSDSGATNISGFTISTNKDHNKLVINGVENTDYTITNSSTIDVSGQINGTDTVEFVAISGFTVA